MGLRTLLRTTATLATATVVAALLTAPSATARPCADCEDPDLPGPGGPDCPTILATSDPYIQAPTSPSPAKVGSTVIARTGVWNSNTKSMKATWYVGTTPAGSAGDWSNYVANRTVTFTIRPQDVGKPIRLWVRGVGTNIQCYKSEYSDETAAVSLGDAPIATIAPGLSGSPVYGETLTVTDGTWAPAATAITRQWLRDGEPIPGADAATYQLGLDDVERQLSVRVSAERAGHSTGSTTVDVGKVTRAAAPVWTGKKVGLKGKNKVKKKVKVALGAKKIREAADASGAKVSFQWLRNGKKIKKETNRAHKIVKADRKKKLKVRIKIVQPGHKPLVITTKAVKIKNNGKKIK